MRLGFLIATAAVWVFFMFYWNAVVLPIGPGRKLHAAHRGVRPDGTARRISVRFRLSPSGQTARRSESDRSRMVHVMLLWAALIIALFPWFGALRGRWLPAWEWWGPAGLGVQLAAAGLYLWGKRVLGRNWSGAITIKEGHELVRRGPFRVVRHPLYVGMLGMFLGTAVVWGEWHALVGFVIATAAYVRKIVLEERQLREEFGAAWEEYRGATWAIIPGVL